MKSFITILILLVCALVTFETTTLTRDAVAGENSGMVVAGTGLLASMSCDDPCFLSVMALLFVVFIVLAVVAVREAMMSKVDDAMDEDLGKEVPAFAARILIAKHEKERWGEE